MMLPTSFNPKISLDFQDILKGLSQLKVTELEQLVDELHLLVKQRKEQELIEKIKTSGLSKIFHERLCVLGSKSINESLDTEELEEYRKMTSTSEQWAVTRLKYLIELSQLWEISVDETMKRLNITTPPTIYA